MNGTWYAPNREHDFTTYFTDEGIRVIPRTEENPSWEWGLALVGYGQGDAVRPVAGARLSPADNRIDYDRGDVVEWYVNAPRGLKQGFTLTRPPLNEGSETRGTTLYAGDVITSINGEPVRGGVDGFEKALEALSTAPSSTS